MYLILSAGFSRKVQRVIRRLGPPLNRSHALRKGPRISESQPVEVRVLGRARSGRKTLGKTFEGQEMGAIKECENTEGGNKGSGLGEGSEGESVGGARARALAAADGASGLARLPDRSPPCLPSADAAHRLFRAHRRADVSKRVCT